MGRKSKKSRAEKKHLTLDDRIVIQSGIKEGKSISAIGRDISKPASTVQREIARNKTTIPAKGNDCIHRRECTFKHMCNNACNKPCHFCPNCKKYCSRYEKIHCELIQKSRYGVCGACTRAGACGLERYRYKASEAQKKYETVLRSSRDGFRLTCEDICLIDDIVSPLVKKGISVYSIKAQYKDRIPVSESTLRRLIDAGELDARNIDLRDKVKRRPPKKRRETSGEISVSKRGHEYKDYVRYMNNNDIHAVQMDCVEGSKDSTKVLLTLHFPDIHFQWAFIMDAHTQECVTETFDLLEYSIGSDIFKQLFPVILTDNGHEFLDIDGIETSINEGQRTKLFFCEPNRSDQKGSCENNHKYIRYVIPKGTSMDNFVQPQIVTVMNHINSFPRKSLLGKSPYELAEQFFPSGFMDALGIEAVPFEDINLTPSLIK